MYQRLAYIVHLHRLTIHCNVLVKKCTFSATLRQCFKYTQLSDTVTFDDRRSSEVTRENDIYSRNIFVGDEERAVGAR